MTNFTTKTQIKRKLVDIFTAASKIFHSQDKPENKSSLSCSVTPTNQDKAIFCNYLFADYDSAPKLEDYVQRTISLVDAAVTLISNRADRNSLYEMLDSCIEFLRIECDITTKLQELKNSYANKKTADHQKQYNKDRLIIIENANKKFNELIFRLIWGTNHPTNFLTKLFRPFLKEFLGDNYPVNIIKFIRREDESNSSALARLKVAEVELRKIQNRPELINIFNLPAHNNQQDFYLCHQTPVARYSKKQMKRLNIDQGKEEYFHPASVSQDEGVANFNRETLVKFENNEDLTIQRVFYSHCALPPLGVKDNAKRMNMTLRNAEQVIEIVAEKSVAEALEQDPTALDTNSEHNPLPVSLTELRLLSVTRNNFIFNFFDKSQRQYQQTLEMFLAFNICNQKTTKMSVKLSDGRSKEVYIKPDIWFGNFGVNGFRNEFFSDELLNIINTRYLNQVFESCLDKLQNDLHYQFILDPKHQKAKKRVARLHQNLALQFERLNFILSRIDSLTNVEDIETFKYSYQKQQKTILSLLYAAQSQEQKLLAHNKNCLEQIASQPTNNFNIKTRELIANLKQVKHLTETPLHSLLSDFSNTVISATWLPNIIKNTLGRLINSAVHFVDNYFSFLKRYTYAENNYWLQTILARINDNQNRELLIGCRENKDRGGRLNATLMADSIYKQTYTHDAQPNKPAEKSVFNNILGWILPRSTAFFNSEYCSVPGARGFDIQTQHGNEHLAFLKENKAMARWGKDIYSPVLGFKLIDQLAQFKKWISQRFFTRNNTDTQNTTTPQSPSIIKLSKKVSSMLGAATLAATLSIAPGLASQPNSYETGASIISPINADPTSSSESISDAAFTDQLAQDDSNENAQKVRSKDDRSETPTHNRIRTSMGKILDQINAADHRIPGKHRHRGKKKDEKDEILTERGNDSVTRSTGPRPFDPDLNLIFDENEVDHHSKPGNQNPKNPDGDDSQPLVERSSNPKIQSDADTSSNDAIKNFLRSLTERIKASATHNAPSYTINSNSSPSESVSKPPTPT